MASTIKLQDAAQSSVSNLFSSLTTNTAKENVEKEVIKTVTTTGAEKKSAGSSELDLTKVGVCFNVPKYIRDMWKTYFTTHGLTMTDGLIQAVNYLKEQEEKGEVKLGAISILKN